jgi:ATP-binding cassette subfamily F protein uup
MNILSAEGLSKSYGENWLFQDLTLGIQAGERWALVGVNGAGKSTLLNILGGKILPDSGKVSYREGTRFGFLSQHPELEGYATVRDVIYSDNNTVAAMVKRYNEALNIPDFPEGEMQTLLTQMDEHQAWDYEARVATVLDKLGVYDLHAPLDKLSGGQKRRVFLAGMLLAEPDILLLDEPTNHLDLDAIEWLEGFLTARGMTLLMVTHDRYFLDKVATGIMELSRETIHKYGSGYANFLESKQAREDALKAEVARARNLMKRELEWMRRQPQARGTKSRARIDAFYELIDKASIKLEKDTLELKMKESRVGGKILELINISKTRGDRKLISDFEYTFKKGDRIGIVGKNGSGKSTLLEILSNQIEPDTGKVVAGLTTQMGYFTQEAKELNHENRVIEEIREIAEYVKLSDGTKMAASRLLENFLFTPEKQYTYINRLSGGEKKRLQLLKVLISNPNFLILDEPTNDLDLDTLTVLEDFLMQYTACLVMVSHDRFFLDNLVDQLFVFENGQIKIFPGNYTDWRLYKDQMPDEKFIKKTNAPAEDKKEEKKPKLTYGEKLAFEKLEKEIPALEAKKQELNLKINDASTPHEELTALIDELGAVSDQLEEKEMLWLEISEKM